MGEGVRNMPKVRYVIYDRSLSAVIYFCIHILALRHICLVGIVSSTLDDYENDNETELCSLTDWIII